MPPSKASEAGGWTVAMDKSLTIDGIDSAVSETEPLVQRDPDHEPHKKRHVGWGIVIAVVMGFIFGFIFEKSRVFQPDSIRAQFVFKEWLMLKMFMAALASSAFSLLLVSIFHPKLFEHVRDEFHDCRHRGVLTATALGAFMLGAGMAIGGACPGMVSAQVGSGVNTAYATLLGCLVGALAHGLLEPFIEKWIQMGPKFNFFYITERFKLPYWPLGIALMIMGGGVAGLLEYFHSWQSEVPQPFKNKNGPCNFVFDCPSWPPWASGIILGLLQIPAILVIKDTLGSSTAYDAVTSLATHALQDHHKKTHYPRFHGRTKGWGNWWQVFYLCASMLGALASAGLSHSLGKVHGLHPMVGFAGGFLMLFGSRLAAGCTSGHGISGMSLLNASSLVAVPCMFGGGIAVAFLYNLNPDAFLPSQ
eukprot:m.21186 g.21186  ORF g.21186 m.21186 type:complete len:419 (+) comp8254_c0_seq2:397-1653(+)